MKQHFKCQKRHVQTQEQSDKVEKRVITTNDDEDPRKEKNSDLDFEIENEDTKVEKMTKLEKREEIKMIKSQEYAHNIVLTNE